MRQTFFGDIQTRHYFYTRHDRICDRFFRTQYFAQNAIDTKAHDETILERFDVNIARAFFHRLGENGVDESNDRRVVFRFEQILRFGQFVGERFQIEVVVEICNHGARIVALFVQRAQQTFEAGGVVDDAISAERRDNGAALSTFRDERHRDKRHLRRRHARR